MFLSALYLWCSMSYLIHAETVKGPRPINFRYVDNGTLLNINITEMTDKKNFIIKCCPGNQTLFKNLQTYRVSCAQKNKLTHMYNIIVQDDFLERDIYNNNIDKQMIKTKKVNQFIRIYCTPASRYRNEVAEIYAPPNYEPYILENGTLVIRQLNYYNQWRDTLLPGQFCVDDQAVLGEDGNVSTQLGIRFIQIDVEETTNQKNTVIAYGFLVSCVFLVLVLIAYALLPELRNLAGLMLMAYVSTLLAAFLSRAAQVLTTDNDLLDEAACVYLGFIQYYTILASFTWMNVMSFDIWWSMRGFRKLGDMSPRVVLVKLRWYGLYGWGAPMLPVVFMIVVQNLDFTHLPNFVQPHYKGSGCFMPEEERLLYMNGPILITTSANIWLFLMTAYNIREINRGVSEHCAGESRRNNNDENRFWIYLKLFLVMGINWILEIVGSVYKADSLWWYAPDVFNSLVGLCIFIIFVCKKKIIVLLCKRLSIGNDLTLKKLPSMRTRTESTRLSQLSDITRNSRH